MKSALRLLFTGFVILAAVACNKNDDYHPVVANSFRLGKNFYNTSTLQPNGNVLTSSTTDGLHSLYFSFYSLPVSNANFRIVGGTPAADTEVSILANMNGQVYQCSNSGVGYAAITVSDTGRIDISVVNTWMLHLPAFADSLQLSADISE